MSVGPADPVVADHDGQRARVAVAFHHDLGVAGPGVLGDVGERLGHHEVGDRLHRGLRPHRHVHVHVDRHRAQRGQAGQGRVQAALGQHRRVHAPDEVAQLGKGLFGLRVGLVDQLLGSVGVVGELRLGPAEFHGQRDQPLLRAVVQVTLDPPPLRLGRVHHPLPADFEFGHPGGQVTRRAEQPTGHRRVGDREAPGHLGRDDQHDQAEGRGDRDGRAAQHRVAQLGTAGREVLVIERQRQHDQARGPERDADRQRDRADRQPEQPVAELAPAGPLREHPPPRHEPPPVPGPAVRGPGRDRYPQHEGEPGPLGRGEPGDDPQRQAEDGQPGQREHQQAEAEAEAGDDEGEDQQSREQARQVAGHGEPGAR